MARAGDVIPDIIKVLPELRTGKEKEFKMPTICPSCKTKLEKSDTEALYKCPNSKCFARRRRSFYHFVSKHNLRGLAWRKLKALKELKKTKLSYEDLVQ